MDSLQSRAVTEDSLGPKVPHSVDFPRPDGHSFVPQTISTRCRSSPSDSPIASRSFSPNSRPPSALGIVVWSRTFKTSPHPGRTSTLER